MGERQEGAGVVSSQPFNPATHSSVQVSLERSGVASPFRHHLQQRGPELLLFSTCTGPFPPSRPRLEQGTREGLGRL